MNPVRNANLCIALPTYNRAAFLDVALARLIAVAAPHGVGILVSDNASTDDTAAVVARHQAGYPLLDYVRNAENLGPDGNFEAVLRRTETRYVWLFGDTYEIGDEALERVLAAISAGWSYDAIVVDIERRPAAVPGRVYEDRDALLADLGWHMTCMSTLVLSGDLVRTGAFERYRGTSFIHVGIVFDHLARRVPSVLWLPEAGVRTLHIPGRTKTSVWERRTFEIWVDSWTGFVLSLPALYTLQAKLLCVLRHGERSGLFSLANLVKLRSAGVLELSTATGRWTALRLATGWRRFLILACALMPGMVARAAVRARTGAR